MIDRSLASFLEEGLGIHIGTRDADLQPSGARALAVKVEDDGAHLVVFVAKAAASRILPDLRANGQVAVLFGRPTDDRSCQVKAVFVRTRAAREDEHPVVRAQFEGFLNSLETIGIARDNTTNWATWPATAIRLRATALFDQTPGPGAGAPLP